MPPGPQKAAEYLFSGSAVSSVRSHPRLVMVYNYLFLKHSSSLLSTLEDSMKITPGKLAGLKKVSNDRGIIAAAAMDQRGSLQKSLAKEKGGEITDAMMEEFKSIVTAVLTEHASAILLDQ